MGCCGQNNIQDDQNLNKTKRRAIFIYGGPGSGLKLE